MLSKTLFQLARFQALPGGRDHFSEFEMPGFNLPNLIDLTRFRVGNNDAPLLIRRYGFHAVG